MTETYTIVRRVVVEGAVQGVAYREFARRAALRLNVSGWVRNRTDRAVEAVIRGPAAPVEALIAQMRKGPRTAVVERLSVFESGETHGDDSAAFVIRPTA